MKRTAVGLALLVLLLAGAILSGRSQVAYHQRVSDLLEQASRAAMEDRFPAAVEMALDARGVWEQGWMAAAVLTDHAPLEQIDVGFRRLEVYAQAGDTLSFGVLCADLAGQVEALGDAHGAQWWNFL